MNDWNGIGRLTRDPEVNYSKDGVAVCKLSVAIDRHYKNQQGEREADFIPVKCFKKLAESCGNNLKKGRLVGVNGEIRTYSYDTKDGQRRSGFEIYADSVQFLDWPKNEGE